MNQTDRIPALLGFTSEWEKGFRKQNERRKIIRRASSTTEKTKRGSVVRCGAGCLAVVDKVVGRRFLEKVTVGPRLEF